MIFFIFFYLSIFILGIALDFQLFIHLINYLSQPFKYFFFTDHYTLLFLLAKIWLSQMTIRAPKFHCTELPTNKLPCQVTTRPNRATHFSILKLTTSLSRYLSESTSYFISPIGNDPVFYSRRRHHLLLQS